MASYVDKIKKSDIVCKSQIGALSECSDLIDNGYVFMFSVVNPDCWYFKFRHRCNGRIIKVIWESDSYKIMEGEHTLKQCLF